MKTNLKLLLPAAFVFGVTLVASGKPLPLVAQASAAIASMGEAHAATPAPSPAYVISNPTVRTGTIGL